MTSNRPALQSQLGTLPLKASGRSTVTLIGFTPDGTEIQLRTSGRYDYAGVVWNRSSSSWEIAAKGWSRESVTKRTRTKGGPLGLTQVVPLMEDLPAAVKEYFTRTDGPASLRLLRVLQVFKPGSGWIHFTDYRPTKRVIRQLAAEGYTSVGIGFIRGDRTADFDLAQLNARTPSRPLLGGALIGSRTW